MEQNAPKFEASSGFKFRPQAASVNIRDQFDLTHNAPGFDTTNWKFEPQMIIWENYLKI